MLLSRNYLIGAIFILVVVIGALYFAMRPVHLSSAQPTATSTNATTTYNVDGTTIVGPAGATIQEVAVTIPALDYNAAIAFSSNISASERATINTQAAAARAAIAKSPTDINGWISLGDIYNEAGDYAHAKAVWVYLTERWPSDPTAFSNLGDLYMSIYQDYPEAEHYYLAELAFQPKDLSAYHELYTIYTVDYKVGTGAAEQILKQGIAANPNAADLQVLLARYYKMQGNTAAAGAEYQQAISTANRIGNASLAVEIRSEENGQ